MRRTILALAAVSTVLISAPALAEPVEIKPSSPWNADFGENRCRLARFFGEGEGRHIVFFEQYWPDDRVGLTVGGPSYKAFRSRQRTNLKFFEGQAPLRTEPFTGTIGSFGEGVVFSSVDLTNGTVEGDDNNATTTGLAQLGAEAAKQVEFVSLQQRGHEVRLMTGPLGEGFAVLNRCAQDLVSSWGLDLEKHRTATRLPRWTNADAVIRKITSAYPRGALVDGEQGITRMRVIVSETGTVEDCTIIKATETERLESPACTAMREARFEPALDAGGKPMRSYFAESIVYQVRR